ncbi:PLP-dependent aspartate aminotransferase family protein [Sediminibacillus albus]|uniref:O-acetylhomoserine (Thiol)-lyase n=1 Tax=Sediminibacillus albus TaxID=407036 RepID=A0A1G8ZR18_9BACI|nr:PLP-dependent aspartate aminotransferase family protein [Sediminibacillus albus]SDK17552.1 O-acetylhomoserine (thiol)-lyase [Sediminibacillus albus]
MADQFHLQGTETQLLHGGQAPDPATGSRAVPIYQTTSYVFKDTEHAQNLFALAEPGNIYSRIMNPTVDAFEQRIALLEDGVAAVATSSGMAAITLSILNIAGSGDEIVADSNLYGGTYNLFAKTLPRYGINVTFVDATDPENVRAAINENTKAVFGEIITNPSLNVLDVEAISAIAHEHSIPLIIDNTFATPYVTKPIAWGADIVVHSATKWIGGHGTTIGGVVIDGGRFNWNNPKFPEFINPDESYHGIRYAVDTAPAAFATKLRVQLLRDIGACLSPQNAFLLLQGLETLHLRIEKHAQNAQQVANYLNQHPLVAWVSYPGLEKHPSHQLAQKYLNGKAGSIITFGIQGGRNAGRQLIDNVSLWSHVANVGDAKSLIIHPASTTHQQLDAVGLRESGVTEELVRLSIGIETPEDLIQDLDQAIAEATGTQPTITATNDKAVKWALHSPFDRENGLRQKTIAVLGIENSPTQPVNQTAARLQNLGYKIIPVHSGQEEILGEKPVAEVGAIEKEIDIIYTKDILQAEALLANASKPKTKILWIDSQEASLDVTDQARVAGITVVESLCPYQEAVRLRNGEVKQPVYA